MAARWRPMSLMVLPEEVVTVIVGHPVATSERPLDNLCSLRVTCSFMRHICSDGAVGQRLGLDGFSRQWRTRQNDDDINYDGMLANLIKVGNPEVCFANGMETVFREEARSPPCLDDIKRAADGGHNAAAYMFAILLYRNNGGAEDDATTRWYMRQVVGGEESSAVAAGGGPSRRWLGNKGLLLCQEQAVMALSIVWRKFGEPLPQPAQVRSDLPCLGGVCGISKGFEQMILYCSEDCRLRGEMNLFERVQLGV